MAIVVQCDGWLLHNNIATPDPIKDGWFRAWQTANSITVARCAKEGDPGKYHFCCWRCFSIWAERQLEVPSEPTTA